MPLAPCQASGFCYFHTSPTYPPYLHESVFIKKTQTGSLLSHSGLLGIFWTYSCIHTEFDTSLFVRTTRVFLMHASRARLNLGSAFSPQPSAFAISASRSRLVRSAFMKASVSGKCICTSDGLPIWMTPDLN